MKMSSAVRERDAFLRRRLPPPPSLPPAALRARGRPPRAEAFRARCRAAAASMNAFMISSTQLRDAAALEHPPRPGPRTKARNRSRSRCTGRSVQSRTAVEHASVAGRNRARTSAPQPSPRGFLALDALLLLREVALALLGFAPPSMRCVATISRCGRSKCSLRARIAASSSSSITSIRPCSSVFPTSTSRMGSTRSRSRTSRRSRSASRRPRRSSSGRTAASGAIHEPSVCAITSASGTVSASSSRYASVWISMRRPSTGSGVPGCRRGAARFRARALRWRRRRNGLRRVRVPADHAPVEHDVRGVVLRLGRRLGTELGLCRVRNREINGERTGQRRACLTRLHPS